jgi:hypothetical protein
VVLPKVWGKKLFWAGLSLITLGIDGAALENIINDQQRGNMGDYLIIGISLIYWILMIKAVKKLKRRWEQN